MKKKVLPSNNNFPTSLQLDSYLLERLKNITPAQKEKLTYMEWRRFLKQKLAFRMGSIPLHEKLTLLSKLDVGYALFLFDKQQSAQATSASYISLLLRNSCNGELDDSLNPFFVFGSGEMERFLLRLEALFNSKLYPIASVIKRDLNRDTFKFIQEATKREEFLSFILRISTEIFKYFHIVKTLSLTNPKSNYPLKLAMLFVFYDINKPMDVNEVDSYFNFAVSKRELTKALNGLSKEGLIEVSRYPVRGIPNKDGELYVSYFITAEGNEKVRNTLNEIILKFK